MLKYLELLVGIHYEYDIIHRILVKRLRSNDHDFIKLSFSFLPEI